MRFLFITWCLLGLGIFACSNKDHGGKKVSSSFQLKGSLFEWVDKTATLPIFITAKTSSQSHISFYQKAFLVDDKIYLGVSTSFPPLIISYFVAYNPSKDTWKKKIDFTDMPVRISFVADKKIYIVTDQRYYIYETTADNLQNYLNTANFKNILDQIFFNILAFTQEGTNNSGLAYIGLGVGDDPKGSADFWKYDVGKDQLSKLASYPNPQDPHSSIAFTLANTGYVGHTLGSRAFHKYDPQANQWLPIAPFIGAEREYPVGFVLQGKAYVGLGMRNKKYFGDWAMYDPQQDSWVMHQDDFFKSKKYALNSMTSFVFKDKVYLLYLAIENNEWRLKFLQGSLKTPSP